MGVMYMADTDNSESILSDITKMKETLSMLARRFGFANRPVSAFSRKEFIEMLLENEAKSESEPLDKDDSVAGVIDIESDKDHLPVQTD